MKKKLTLFIVTAMASLLMVGCTSTTTSNKEIKTYKNDGSKTVTISNDDLEFTVDKDSTQFKLVNKKNNKVYTSNPSAQDVEKYANAKGPLKEVISSTLNLTYSNSTDTRKEINNFSASVGNGNYSIEKVSDNEVDVNYSIGEIERQYLCPLAVKVDVMEKYLEGLDSSTKRAVTRNYVKYEYDGFESDAERDMALEKFPDLQEHPVYYLNEKITESKAKPLEEIFAKIGYTEEQRAKDMEGYNIDRNSGKPVFSITMQYILEDNELVVNIPMDKIEYNTKYPIVELQVLPYMGSANKDEEGFSIVPDGTGGIINFNNGKTTQQTYLAEMYGWDYGINRKSVVDETRATFPMFAIANKSSEQSFLCVSEAGSAYSSVMSDIAGKKSGYNYSRFVYKMVHGENMDISSKSDTTVRIFEDGLPKGENIRQRYIFSQDTDYVSLAKTYREYLMKKYPEIKKPEEGSIKSVPMAVELIGAVDNVEHILGYPVTRPLALTTYEDAQKILTQLSQSGISNISAKYTGWFNGGVDPTSAAHVDLIGRLGGSSDLKALNNFVKNEAAVNFYYGGKFMYVGKNKLLFDGFNVNRDSAKFVSREICEIYSTDPVTYQSNEDYETCGLYYLTKPSYMLNNIDHFVDEITSYGGKNVSFEDIGYSLAGDYNYKSRVSREASLNKQVEKLKALKEHDNGVMITTGNMYAVPYADYVTDLNISPKAVNIIDESIPFLEIALHGLVKYSGSAINLSADEKDIVLKSAETGSVLYFTFMNAPTSVLQDGQYTQYYACNFTDWKDTAVELYNRFNKELGDTYGSYITNHEKLAEGVYKTTFENGNYVVVNYNYSDYEDGTYKVPKRDFVTKKTNGGDK
ncbi:MAG: hypothetical protein K6G63_06120 [Eubacterium sp.]|nr:hypothetical protein [Eubacterium sp.]